MKILIALLLFISSCMAPAKVIHPKIIRIVPTDKGTLVYVWYRDSWLVSCFDTLPAGYKKGVRIEIHPAKRSATGTVLDSCSQFFQRTSRPKK